MPYLMHNLYKHHNTVAITTILYLFSNTGHGGFNMAGLQFLQRQLDVQGQPVFADVTEQLHKMRKKRKITTHK